MIHVDHDLPKVPVAAKKNKPTADSGEDFDSIDTAVAEAREGSQSGTEVETVGAGGGWATCSG